MLADWSLLKLNLTLAVTVGDQKNSLGVHDKKTSGMCESKVIILSFHNGCVQQNNNINLRLEECVVFKL